MYFPSTFNVNIFLYVDIAFLNSFFSSYILPAESRAVKLQDLSLEINYEYKRLLETVGEKITYFPEHSLTADIIFNKYDWELNLSLTGETEQYGTMGQLKIEPYLILNFNIIKKISDNISVYGYLNNILNNKYYLLYYYLEKGLNLGLGLILTF